MSDLSSNPMSVEQFEALVGASIPAESQEIPAYLQTAFQAVAGQIAEELAGPDAATQLGRITANVNELAGRYNLTLPLEVEEVVPFVVQLGQLWVPEQLPENTSNVPKLDPTITRTDPDSVGYGIEPTGNPQPIGSLVSTGGQPARASESYSWSQHIKTPLSLPPGKTFATRIQIRSTGRAISTIVIWNGDDRVDLAPSDNQYDKGVNFPLQYRGQSYTYEGRCTHIQIFMAGGGQEKYHVDVTA